MEKIWEDASNKIAYDQRCHYVEAMRRRMNYPHLDLLMDPQPRSSTGNYSAINESAGKLFM